MFRVLHCVVSNTLPASNVVREIDVANQIFSLELIISIAGVQLALINRFIFIFLFVILRLG